VRILLIKILLCIASGLLFGHQFIAHYHHEEAEITSTHHDDENEGDDHQNQFPVHQVAHIFSFDKAGTGAVKAPVREIYFDPIGGFIFPKTVQFENKKEYVEIRPPVSGYYKYFSLRGPPSFLG
jgi:hypothetical protein